MNIYWQPSLRVFLHLTGNDEYKYCLSIQHGKVVIAETNPHDLNQTKLVQYDTSNIMWSTLFTESFEQHSGYANIRLSNYVNWHLYVQWGATKAGSEVRQGLVDNVTSALWKMKQQPEPRWKLFLQSSHVPDNTYCLSVRNEKVVVAQTDPRDENQYWIRDERFSYRADTEGCQAFSLFNTGTHQAIQHAGGGDDFSQPTKLTYHDMFTESSSSTFFTEGPIVGDGYRVIKLENYVNWFLYVHWGRIADGSEVCQCVKGYAEAGLWKLEVAYDQSIPKTIYRVQCMQELGYSLGVRDGLAVMLPDDPDDVTQSWIRDTRYSDKLYNGGMPGFALINKGTTEILVHYKTGAKHHVLLIPFEPTILQEGRWWSESFTESSGFYNIRCLDNTDIVFTIHQREEPGFEPIPLMLAKETNSKEMLWKITQRG